MSRTRAAPTPTYISTKSEPDRLKNGTPASPATALASSVLPVPGGPTSSTPRGNAAAEGLVLAGRSQKFDDFAQLVDRFVDARRVGERDVDVFLGVEPAAAAAERHRRPGSDQPPQKVHHDHQHHDARDPHEQVLPVGRRRGIACN